MVAHREVGARVLFLCRRLEIRGIFFQACPIHESFMDFPAERPAIFADLFLVFGKRIRGSTFLGGSDGSGSHNNAVAYPK